METDSATDGETGSDNVIETETGSVNYCNVRDQGPISLLFPDSLASLTIIFVY